MLRTQVCYFVGIVALAVSSWAYSDWVDPMQRPAPLSTRWDRALLLDAAVYADLPSPLFAVGEQGAVLQGIEKEGALTWSQLRPPVSATLTSLTRMGNNMIIVGHEGLILRYDLTSNQWQVLLEGFEANRHMKAEVETLLEEQADQLASDTQETLNWNLSDLDRDIEQQSTKPFLDVELLSQDPNRMMAVGAYGMAFLSQDEGRSWRSIATQISNPDRLHLNAVHKMPGGHWLLIGEQGLVRMSKDQGRSWQVVESESQSSWFAVESVGSYTLVGGIRGALLYSLDGGEQWQLTQLEAIGTALAMRACSTQWICIFGRKGLISAVHITPEGPQLKQQWQLKNRLDITAAVSMDQEWWLTLERGFQRWAPPE